MTKFEYCILRWFFERMDICFLRFKLLLNKIIKKSQQILRDIQYSNFVEFQNWLMRCERQKSSTFSIRIPSGLIILFHLFSDPKLWFVNCREKYDGRTVGSYKTWCFLFTNLLKVPFCNSFSIRLLTFFEMVHPLTLIGFKLLSSDKLCPYSVMKQ